MSEVRKSRKKIVDEFAAADKKLRLAAIREFLSAARNWDIVNLTHDDYYTDEKWITTNSYRWMLDGKTLTRKRVTKGWFFTMYVEDFSFELSSSDRDDIERELKSIESIKKRVKENEALRDNYRHCREWWHE